MGFQSGINAALGSISVAAFGIKKTLQQRQEEQMKKVKEQQDAKQEQKNRFRKSPILNAQGQNIQVPVTKKETKATEDNKSILLGADGRNITNGNK